MAAGALAVGAAFFVSSPSCGVATPTLEPFSSAGGDPILFDVNRHASRDSPAGPRQKPDLVGPDGGNDTFLGFTLASGKIPDPSTVAQCANNASYPNFFGTSAAAPHVASIAALMLQADPALTPTQLYTFLRQSAVAIGAAPTVSAPNYAAGYGFVQANLAETLVPAIVPAAPTLTLTDSSIVTGTSTTITWSSANTTGCTASGAWSGALTSTGSQTVAPTAVGSDTYTIVCANFAGNSPPTSATLAVTAPASTGGGGGSLQLTMLLGLLGLCVARVQHERRRSRLNI